jgi:hypothetical protein
MTPPRFLSLLAAVVATATAATSSPTLAVFFAAQGLLLLSVTSRRTRTLVRRLLSLNARRQPAPVARLGRTAAPARRVAA